MKFYYHTTTGIRRQTECALCNCNYIWSILREALPKQWTITPSFWELHMQTHCRLAQQRSFLATTQSPVISPYQNHNFPSYQNRMTWVCSCCHMKLAIASIASNFGYFMQFYCLNTENTLHRQYSIASFRITDKKNPLEIIWAMFKSINTCW